MRRKLKTIHTKAAEGPFTEGQLRWYIFNEQSNGLAAAGAVVRVGRRVYLDDDNFDSWIDTQNSGAIRAA